MARLVLILSLLLLGSVVQAQTLTLAAGKTIRSNTTEHEAYRVEANFGWLPELWMAGDWSLTLNHALSIVHFRDRNNVSAISWGPNLIFAPTGNAAVTPFLQFGFGVAYLSDDRFESDTPPRYRFNGELLDDEGRANMGSHGQFESSIGAGVIIDRFGLRAKVYHYSNAGLASQNDGMDVFEAGMSYAF